MPSVTTGKQVPDFELPATGEASFKLSDLRGKRIVLYFYPKDSTPGCTLEGRGFRDRIAAFTRNETVVFGISRDGMKSHERFREKQEFPFALLSDAEEKACRLFDVIKEKTMFGKKVRGIQRSTFLIDEKGVLRREWRKVKVAGHVDEVLTAVKALGK